MPANPKARRGGDLDPHCPGGPTGITLGAAGIAFRCLRILRRVVGVILIPIAPGPTGIAQGAAGHRPLMPANPKARRGGDLEPHRPGMPPALKEV
jgi:hypothetical protein